MGLLIGGSVDGLCLCVWLCCGWVMAEVAGSSGFSMGFFFFFFKYGFLFRWDFGEQWAVVAWVFLGFCSDGFVFVCVFLRFLGLFVCVCVCVDFCLCLF